MSTPNYDTTIARIAGTIAAGLVNHPDMTDAAHGLLPDRLARVAVDLARRIVAHVTATDPPHTHTPPT